MAMTETMPPQGDEMPDPQTPDEVPPQGPTEEGLPQDDDGSIQTPEDLQQGGSMDDSGEGGGPA
jgi:hypothetical protein